MNAEEFEKIQIPVVEIFQSVSGEGISAGNIVSFVRVAGCDLRCTWCDTKYSFKESGEGVEFMYPHEIVNKLHEFGSSEIICTGGEPLEEGKIKRYLPVYLAANHFSIRIETSGGSPLYSVEELQNFNLSRSQVAYCMDIKCPYSRMEHKNRYENIPELRKNDELKFVVADQNDLNFSMDIIENNKMHLTDNQITLNFSPVFETMKPEMLVNFLKENTVYFKKNRLQARLSLQLHKFIWPPHQRGV